MSNELDAEIALLAAVARRALKDAARGDDAALSFVRELLPERATTSERMNAFIRQQARGGMPTVTTGLPADASPQPARRADANAGAHRQVEAPAHPHDAMNAHIRRMAGRGTP